MTDPAANTRSSPEAADVAAAAGGSPPKPASIVCLVLSRLARAVLRVLHLALSLSRHWQFVLSTLIGERSARRSILGRLC